jgi:hypothetical protein
MTDYGKGAVPGATLLPATSAGIMALSSMHPLVVAGFIVINVIWLALLVGHISRYLVNHK